MKFERWLEGNRKVLVIALVAFLVLALWHAGAFNAFRLATQEIGYLTATQGLQAEFHSLWFNGTWCSAAERPSWAQRASSWSFGYNLVFDPDDAYDGWPDLCASQQPMTLDPMDVPAHYVWTVDKGEVTLEDGTKARKVLQFEMWRYKLDWSINVWLSGTEAETCDTTYFNVITWVPDYAGTQIWIRLVPKNFLYFKDNPDELYMAPCYIGVKEIKFVTYDQDKRETVNDPDAWTMVDLFPKAVGETLGIYYARGGTPVNVEHEVMKYKGAELDPRVFKGEYWTKIDLLTFKPKTWYEYQIWHKWKYPSVNIKFTVYILVVGKWTVYLKTGEVPQLQGHTPTVQTNDPISDFFKSVGNWFSVNWWWIFLLIMIVVAVVAFAHSLPLILLARRR